MRIRRQVERTFEALSTVLNGCATCSSRLRLLRSCSRSRHGGERCRRDSEHAVAMESQHGLQQFARRTLSTSPTRTLLLRSHACSQQMPWPPIR